VTKKKKFYNPDHRSLGNMFMVMATQQTVSKIFAEVSLVPQHSAK
jgi:hypothetical protein